MKHILFFLLCFYSSHLLFAQDKQIQGIVFDADSKQRVSRVYIYNTRTEKGFYNNTKGEFTTTVNKGDILVAATQGYGVDTITVRSQSAIIFYLKRNSILLSEVSIKDSLSNPKDRFKETQKDYKDAYRKGSTKDMLQIGGGNGTGGAGIGIDALWSLLSKEGKNARYLQKILERDYHDSMVNYRYTRSLVSNITGLTDEKLSDFMLQYRPSYYFVLQANDYALIEFVRGSFQKYTRAPHANRLQPLKP